MTKRFLSLAILLSSLVGITDARRANSVITVTSGTPIRLITGSTIASRLFIQMVHGGTSIGYVCIVDRATTPASKCSTAGQLAAELAPATATAPGGSYSDATFGPNLSSGVDISTVWVDGDHSGDTILVSWDTRF